MRATVDTSYDTQMPPPQPASVKSATDRNVNKGKITDEWLPSPLIFVDFPKKFFEGAAVCQLRLKAAVDVVKNHPNRNTAAVIAVTLAIGLSVVLAVTCPKMMACLIAGIFLGALTCGSCAVGMWLLLSKETEQKELGRLWVLAAITLGLIVFLVSFSLGPNLAAAILWIALLTGFAIIAAVNDLWLIPILHVMR